MDDARKEIKGMSQKNVITTAEMTRNEVRKLPNWKAPGPDGVQSYWLENVPSLHDRIVRQMSDMINNTKNIPDWLTKGRIVLCQNDPQKGNAVDNFRPISCLPFIWKLMTDIIFVAIVILLILDSIDFGDLHHMFDMELSSDD